MGFVSETRFSGRFIGLLDACYMLYNGIEPLLLNGNHELTRTAHNPGGGGVQQDAMDGQVLLGCGLLSPKYVTSAFSILLDPQRSI